MVSQFHKENTRAMSEEQFCQVVDAILNGKYSWACVLILKFAGYNPLHYIPYRTYNRLMKENSPSKCRRSDVSRDSESRTVRLEDLPYETSTGISSSIVRGGSRTLFLERFCLSRRYS